MRSMKKKERSTRKKRRKTEDPISAWEGGGMEMIGEATEVEMTEVWEKGNEWIKFWQVLS